MAAKTQILFFFLAVLFSANLQIEARVSTFFSKFTRFHTNDDNVTDPKLPITKEPTPAPAPALAPEVEGFPAPELAPVPASTTPEVQAPSPAPEYFIYTESENGYGLYGTRTSTTDDQTPSTVDVKDEDEILSEELVGGESFERGYNQNKDSYKNNIGGNPSSTRTYGTAFNSIGGNPTTTSIYKQYSNNGYRRSYDGNSGYNNNGYYTSNNPNGYDQIQRQGMSDTRFLENGRYYHDVKNDNVNYYNNRYETERGSSKDQGSYGRSENLNEFNTMEEYEKYQESQHYVP
ncbi:hypothetical protein FNV43_RR13762 [Rhamnella rubrinervis]|uniref:Protein E6-like n=1 Tax=Rhamnella rubrinervis TaxID=2594499 RepID=A0A8K0H1R3_9ROSA|nr:hypothetical protein FNV43_RR13762 [Rhamnella rubrinervis]